MPTFKTFQNRLRKSFDKLLDKQMYALSEKESEIPPKNRVCHGWNGCNSISQGQDHIDVNIRQTYIYTDSSRSIAMTGSVFFNAEIQIIFGTE